MFVYGVFSCFASFAPRAFCPRLAKQIVPAVRFSDEIRVILPFSSHFLKMVLTCRFYEQRYPTLEDVVMVNVRSIADMGAYVHLLEYNNIEGGSKVAYP